MRAKEITVNEALRLIKHQQRDIPAISLFVATDRVDNDSGDGIRANLRRLYRSAEAMLAKAYDRRTRERILSPLRMALSLIHLRRGKGGVAIYHSADFTGVVRIPTPVRDLAVAADSFHLKPVLQCAQMRRRYFILAFRRHHADLIDVSTESLTSIARFDFRHELESKLADFESNAEANRQTVRVRRQKFLLEVLEGISRQVDSRLEGVRAPLILAGPPNVQAMFKEACRYRNLLGRGIDQSVHELSTEQISELAQEIVDQHFARQDQEAIGSFHRAEAAGLASNDIHRIAEAACFGQVQRLIIAEDRNVWGDLNRATGHVQLVARNEARLGDDLLDDIAEIVLLKGGEVTVLPVGQIPGDQPIAAAFRWA